jgi:hypothetical protein
MTGTLSPPPKPGATGTRTTLIGVALLFALVGIVLVVSLELWDASLGVPFHYSGDSNAHAAIPKMVDDHGWYEHNPNLGAPFGQQYHDIPLADNLQILLMKGIGVGTDSYAVIVNSYYLATYLFVAVAALWAFRRLELSAGVAGVLALLFTFLPYHFLRGEIHLFLSGYYAVPLGAWMAIDTLRGRPLFAPVEGRKAGTRWISPSFIRVSLFAAVIGSTSSYYAGFTLLLLMGAVGIRIIRRARLSVAATAGVAAVMIASVQVLNVAPDMLYSRTHGATHLFERPAYQTELYALKLAQLVLPMPDHRLDSFARVRDRYDTTFPVPSEVGYMALGAVSSAGFVWLLLVSVGGPLRRSGRRRRADPEQDWPPLATDERVVALSSLSLVTFLLATIGGISTLLALFAWTQIRAWNRLSVYLAFFGLCAVGILLERLQKILRRRRAPIWLYPAILIAVLVVGLFDQTSRKLVPPHERLAGEFESDAEFVGAIENTLPSGSMVFQFPIVLFPEWMPPHRMADYDELKGYLHSRSLRWSYGGVRGRPTSDWLFLLRDDPVPVLVPAVVASGFRGFYVDRHGYVDRGTALETELRGVLGVEPFVSRNGRLAFFDARPYAARLATERSGAELERLRTATLYPPELYTQGPYPEGPLGTGP